MLQSTKRFRTTHVGSLPRPADLMQFIPTGRLNDNAAKDILARSVNDIVAMQRNAVSDGEFGKESFMTYAHVRLSGFEAVNPPTLKKAFANTREAIAFPEFYRAIELKISPGAPIPSAMQARLCSGPIKYVGQKQLERDIANLKTAMAANGIQEGFMPRSRLAALKTGFKTSSTNLTKSIPEAADQGVDAVGCALRRS